MVDILVIDIIVYTIVEGLDGACSWSGYSPYILDSITIHSKLIFEFMKKILVFLVVLLVL